MTHNRSGEAGPYAAASHAGRTRGERPGRRWPRISLRGLVVLVLVIGGGLGRVVHLADVQREAVTVIESRGRRVGGVVYDWDLKDGIYFGRGQPRWVTWLSDGIGVDYFGYATWVYLPDVSDEEAVRVGRLGRLERVDLTRPSMTDAKLAHLNGLAGLQGISFMDAEITDAGLVHLKGLTRLKSLGLQGTRVTDAGLRHLKGLTDLRTLDLRQCPVTDVGARTLRASLPMLNITR